MTMADEDYAVHSALSDPDGVAEDANASVRARAREDTHPGAQSQPESAPTFGEAVAELWRRVGANYTPPDFIDQDPAGLRKRWAYADRGPWTTKDGVPRNLGRVYALCALAVTAPLFYLIWIIERPSRAFPAVGLVVLFAQFPPLSWLI